MRRRQKGATVERWELLFVDVKKAQLNGVLGYDEWQYVELLDEANAGGKVGRLKIFLYGMRQAASAWEEDYARRLEGEGLVRGVAAPTVFWNE